MFIPSHDGPKSDNLVELVKILLHYTARAQDPQTVLHDLYLRLIEKYEIVPVSIRVSTEHNSESIYIDPIQAFHADQAGLLSEQHRKNYSDMGMTGYSETNYWCDLNMVKLYQKINDSSLPAPSQLKIRSPRLISEMTVPNASPLSDSEAEFEDPDI